MMQNNRKVPQISKLKDKSTISFVFKETYKNLTHAYKLRKVARLWPKCSRRQKKGAEHYMLVPWIVRHSAWRIARFHINTTKTTAFKIIEGRDYVAVGGLKRPLGSQALSPP
jgi:hypothetical protein